MVLFKVLFGLPGLPIILLGLVGRGGKARLSQVRWLRQNKILRNWDFI